MTEKTIIYGKQGWPYTEKARAAYGDNALFIDVKADHEKLEEMLELSKGIRKVPVILEDNRVTIGYGGAWGVWQPVVYRIGSNFLRGVSGGTVRMQLKERTLFLR